MTNFIQLSDGQEWILPYHEDNYKIVTADFLNRALKSLPRFNGYTIRPYTVAEHSLVCYKVAKAFGYSKETCNIVLLHDGHEAILGDIISPVEKFIACDRLKTLKQDTQISILEAFKLPIISDCAPIIDMIDNLVLSWEAFNITLLGSNYKEWVNEDKAKLVEKILLTFPTPYTFKEALALQNVTSDIIVPEKDIEQLELFSKTKDELITKSDNWEI